MKCTKFRELELHGNSIGKIIMDDFVRRHHLVPKGLKNEKSVK